MTYLFFMNKINFFKALSLTFFIFAGLRLMIGGVYAQTTETCAKMTASIIVRNSQGDFVPNANFEIYQQVSDVDGSPKPGKKLAAGKIALYLGKGTVTFSDNNNNFVVKAWTVNNSQAAFWFYNDLHLACGGTTEISEYLSAINFTLRDTDNNLKKNTNFSVYRQRQDADNKPIQVKEDLIGTFNTGESGEIKIYIPSGSRAVDGNGSDYYVLQAAGKNGGTFTDYDIAVSDKNTTRADFVFSDFKLELEDANGQTFPGNTKIEIYKQKEDSDGAKSIGDFVKDIFTNDQGIAIFEYPAGDYAARIKGANNEYQYFWELVIIDGKRTTYNLQSDEKWDPGQAACKTESTLTVYTRSPGNKLISGLKFEIYERVLNADLNPITGTKLGGGTIDATGKSVIKINPDPRKKYALKIYDKNAKAGDFWFFDEIQFSCGENITITKNLPALEIILRDAAGNLKKNKNFSIYTQKFDVDGQPITQPDDLVGNFTTSEKGNFILYLAPDHPYDSNKRGDYVFSSPGEGGSGFNEYYIHITSGENYTLEYLFSDIALELKDGSGRILKNKNVDLYEQVCKSGKNTIGKKLKSMKTDNFGQAEAEYPAGRYALVLKDGLNQDNIFWDLIIKNRTHNTQTIIANLTRIASKDTADKAMANSNINVYSLISDGSGNYIIDRKIKTVKLSSTGNADLSLAPSPYLFTAMYGKIEYGKAIYTANGKLQTVTIEPKAGNEIVAGKKFNLSVSATSYSLAEKLKGYILLQVEKNGEAWYVNSADSKRYYLPNGETAYTMMRKFGLGITNDNLKKIAIGVNEWMESFDYDGDNLPDDTENSIGTDMYNRDSDNDGYLDGEEVNNGYDPLGSGRLPIDKKLSDAQKGKILLAVEAHGEAWYVNPRDGHRFYMKDGDSAYELMRFLSLGIKNSDLDKIEEGTLSN